LTETYRKDIPKKFAERALASKLSKMTPQKIAQELRNNSVKTDRMAEILKLVPDRVRKQVEMWYGITPEYAPTRGYPKAAYQADILRRKVKPNKKVLKQTEVVPSTSAIRV